MLFKCCTIKHLEIGVERNQLKVTHRGNKVDATNNAPRLAK